MLFKTKSNKVKEIENNSKYHVAFVIDNEVVDIIRCNLRLFSILTSSPTAVGFLTTDGGTIPQIGWQYKDDEFKAPAFDITE